MTIEEIELIRLALDTPEHNKNYVKHTTGAKMILNKHEEAINYSQCCKSDSEQLRVEKKPTTWDAFLAGYKKRAEMSGLKYDEVSELHAKTLYKCWKSFDLNP